MRVQFYTEFFSVVIRGLALPEDINNGDFSVRQPAILSEMHEERQSGISDLIAALMALMTFLKPSCEMRDVTAVSYLLTVTGTATNE